MTCAQIRLAISALLDGEDPLVPPAGVRAHLAGCAECRGWQAGAVAVNDVVHRSGFAAEPPDLVGRVLAAAAPAAPRRFLAARQVRLLQIVLAVSAVAQLALALPVLVGVVGEGHHARELVSFDVAVAVGFLAAAVRPRRAGALVPVAVALAACLLATAVLDVAQSSAALAEEAGHLVVALQAGVLWLLGRAGDRPAQAIGLRVTA